MRGSEVCRIWRRLMLIVTVEETKVMQEMFSRAVSGWAMTTMSGEEGAPAHLPAPTAERKNMSSSKIGCRTSKSDYFALRTTQLPDTAFMYWCCACACITCVCTFGLPTSSFNSGFTNLIIYLLLRDLPCSFPCHGSYCMPEVSLKVRSEDVKQAALYEYLIRQSYRNIAAWKQ